MCEVPTLLLHSCCGPCSTSVLERLTEDYRVTLFYYNPNIGPEEEYRKRAQVQREFIAAFPAKHPVTFLEGPYDCERYYELVKGLEQEPEGGARCTVCFEMRLREAAKVAKEGNFDFFTTTLTVSPHKNAPLINELGSKICEELGVNWLHSDFKKKDGYLRSVRMSKEYGLYRQNYCGCVFSMHD